MSFVDEKNKHSAKETPIFSDLSLYKVIEDGLPYPIMTHHDGSLSLVLEFEGLNNIGYNANTYESLFSRIQKVVETLPNAPLTVQFLLERHSKDKNTDNKIDNLPSYLKPRADFLNKLVDDQRVFENRFYIGLHVYATDKGGWQSIKNKIINLVKNNEKAAEEKSRLFDGVEDRYNILNDTYNNIRYLLTDLGINYKEYKTKEDYYNMLQRFTRPSRHKFETVKINDEVDSPRRRLFTGVRSKIYRNEFLLDDVVFKNFLLDTPPEEPIYGGSIDLIQSIPAEFLYSVTFKTLSYQDSKKIINKKTIERQIDADLEKDSFLPDKAKVKELQKLEQSHDMFLDLGGSGVRVSVNFILKLSKKYLEDVEAATGQTEKQQVRQIEHSLLNNVFSKFGRSGWACEADIGWFVYTKIIPGMSMIRPNTDNNELKTIFISSQNLPYLLPMYDTRNNLEHNGVNHFIDERSSLFKFELMDPRLPAWNYIIAGQTGSGKSVLVNTILAMQLADAKKKPMIYILDVGGDVGSYKKIVEIAGGSEINLSSIKKPSIQLMEIELKKAMPTPNKIESIIKRLSKELNDITELKVRAFYQKILDLSSDDYERKYKEVFQEIFSSKLKEEFKEFLSLNPGECEPNAQQLNLIMAVIDSMVNFEDDFGYEKEDLIFLIRETYRMCEDRFPYLSDLHSLMKTINKKGESKSLSKMISRLANWLRDGSYPQFDMDTDVDLSNSVILVDLKGLESEKQFQFIYTMVFQEMFKNRLYKERNRLKIMVRDEAWSLMVNEEARRYAVEDYRTARKSGFANIIVSQKPTDFYHPSPQDGAAIMGQTQVFMIGRISNTDKGDVASVLNLPEGVANRLPNLGVQSSERDIQKYGSPFANFLMLTPNGYFILENPLDSFEYWLYTSTESDVAIINYYRNQTDRFETMEEVLRFLAKGGYKGDEKLVEYLKEGGNKKAIKKVLGGI